MSSYYKITTKCDSGGCHVHSVYRVTNLDDIKKGVVRFMAGMGLYLFCWYSCDIILEVYQNGSRIKKIDLREYIHVLVEKNIKQSLIFF